MFSLGWLPVSSSQLPATTGNPDVVLIHPPSVYDFRDRTTFHGPVSDVIPSSPVFEMYPVGFLTLATFLRRHGYRVRIVNLALLMMRSRRFRPERFLARLRPALFGIDLHWLPHAHGGPAVAALLKKLHPDIPIVFGGISATYFHEELIRNPAVDFVLRGSVTEPSLLALLREVEGGRRFERVPDLTLSRPEAGAPFVSSPAPFGVLQPTAPQRLRQNARHVRLDVENRRSVEHVDAVDAQPRPVAAEALDDGEGDWIRAARGARGEDALRNRLSMIAQLERQSTQRTASAAQS